MLVRSFDIRRNLSEFSNIGVQILGRTSPACPPGRGKALNAAPSARGIGLASALDLDRAPLQIEVNPDESRKNLVGIGAGAASPHLIPDTGIFLYA